MEDSYTKRTGPAPDFDISVVPKAEANPGFFSQRQKRLQHRTMMMDIAHMTHEEVCRRIEAKSNKHQFGILYVHDIPATLEKKGFPLDEPRKAKIYELCNPKVAKEIIQYDFDLVNALPCKLCVIEEGEKSQRLEIVKPSSLMHFFHSDALQAIAKQLDVHFEHLLTDICEGD